MEDPILSPGIQTFAQYISQLQVADLDRRWVWGDYEEGIRFAILRTCEQLLDLSSELGSQRNLSSPTTIAQSILRQYHLAYRDLQAVVINLNDTFAEKKPQPGEWSPKTTLLHVVEAERAFFAINDDGLARTRTADGRPEQISDERFDAYWLGDNFDHLAENGSFSEIMGNYHQLHQRIITAFSTIAETELDIPVYFWESEPMPLRFRLGRFASHLRQHTIQIENTLPAIGLSPNEISRLVRLLYYCLAEVEGVLIGVPDLQSGARRDLADQINNRYTEIVTALSA